MCVIQLVKTKLEGRKETLVASSASTLSLRKCLKVIYTTGKQSQGRVWKLVAEKGDIHRKRGCKESTDTFFSKPFLCVNYFPSNLKYTFLFRLHNFGIQRVSTSQLFCVVWILVFPYG